MITKKDIELYNKNVGHLAEDDVPLIEKLIERKIELDREWDKFQSDYEKLSTDNQIAFKIFMMETFATDVALKRKQQGYD